MGFEVLLQSGRVVKVADVDAYQPEGAMTTFFTSGSTLQVIDSWATRVASYRTADIVAIHRSADSGVSPFSIDESVESEIEIDVRDEAVVLEGRFHDLAM